MASQKKFDFRSDTVTVAGPKMRQAMAEAVVGDDVYGEDPTVNLLEQTAAELLGKEAALFVPTGTMGNLIAILTHCSRGQEVILGCEAHTFFYEGGGASALGGVAYHTVQENELGKISPAQIQAAIRPQNIHFPTTGLLCLENTHNRAGGTISTPAEIKTLTDVVHAKGIPVHMDGARLYNAAVALDIPIKDLCIELDSVQICLSKGLGAPAGSILAGKADFIGRARRWRKTLGGGMRQSGHLAAAGLLALQEGPSRLKTDHENCKRLAEGLSKLKGLSVNLEAVQTNMVYVDVSGTGMTAELFTDRLRDHSILVNATGPTKCRFVTHLNLQKEDIDNTIVLVAKIVGDNF